MKIKGTLPKGDADGITALEAQALKRQKPIVAIVILEPARIHQDLDSGEKELEMRIRRIEGIIPDDMDAVSRHLQRSFEARTGDSTLPIELENDIKDALKGVDTYVPETPVEEEIIVPEGGYSKMNIEPLQKLLKQRGLDHRKATKTELIRRLEEADGDTSEAPSNVTSIFQAPTDPVPDEAVDEPEPRDPEDDAWDAAAPEIPTPAEGEYIDDPDAENDE